MQDMLVTNIHRRDARYNHLNFVCPRYNSRKHTLDAERSFTISAIKAWNMLPLGIRPCSSACILCVIRVNAGFHSGKYALDQTGLFSILYYPAHCRIKKVESTSTLYHSITGSNWNRKFLPKAHARVQFCSDTVRSHAYFLE